MIHHVDSKAVTLLALLVVSLTSAAYAAPTIWDGPPLTFTKVGGGDPALAENQDRITDNVWITRGSSQGIFNAASESAYSVNLSPAGTLWAFGTTADSETLSYVSWEQLVGRNSPLGGPVNMVGLDMVVHLVTDDIYLDLRFLSWGGQSERGSFSYVRSTGTVIPEPSTLAMVAGAFVAVLGWRRWAR